MHRITFICILVCGSIDLAYACDKPQLNIVRSFEEADVIFRGEVEGIQYLDDPEKSKIEARIIVGFKVYEKWKGEVSNIVTLHTTYNRSTCNGFKFKSGKEYLVYARYNRSSQNFIAKLLAPATPTLGVKVNEGTVQFTEAKSNLEFLGYGHLF